ncbi:NAD(P)-binding domain-containing protein [Chondromyces crocatus]|uniref:Glycerol-3-phosphate dehydrogenase n=1 Tax=Chondromyces crocatus TaxID=52 RepID=A0A0K1E6V1_CHOCO|nr:NAD(P)-binding domain-containing protein [Chondromyces crocatus]AKT36585.1 glycerol-3-phosphate dehydrogenase (NAD(P)+) [Chondromyces crocatus]
MSHEPRIKVGVIGGGTWGVALARAARRAGAEVILFSRREQPELREGSGEGRPELTREYARVSQARLLIVAVPSSSAQVALRALGDHLDGGHAVVHGVRGLTGDELQTMSDLIRDETPVRRVGALGGPVQADELLRGLPSAMLCGSPFPEVLATVNRAFQSSGLRVYGTSDLRGLEWASALVGCLAVGVGFAQEAGAGPGLQAALISRGVEEAARIAAAAGAEERTMLGLGGYGDLLASIGLEGRPEVVLGRALARGRSIEEAVLEARLRVEAIPLIPRVVQFARSRGVQAGTFEALERVLEGDRPVALVERLFAA